MSRAATDGATTAGSASHRSVNVPDVTATRAKGRGTRPAYECDVCGYQPAKWVGRCPECGEWGSVVERAAPVAPAGRPVSARTPIQPAQPIASYSVAPARARPTGVSELDRVLGGGLVPGSVVLLAGEPGVGKSTLLLEVAQQWAAGGDGPALVISGEESVGQVRLRAERIGASTTSFPAAETDLAAVLGQLDLVAEPAALDSVQTIGLRMDGCPEVTQVRAVTAALVSSPRAERPVVLAGT